MFKDIRGSDQLPNKSRKKIQKEFKHYIGKMKKEGNLFKDKTHDKLNQAYEELKEWTEPLSVYK